MNQLAESVPEGQEPETPAAAEPIEPTAPEAPPQEEGTVDQPPDASALQGNIEKLKEEMKKLEEDARYWRREKQAARADYFKSRPEPQEKSSAEPKEPTPADYPDYDKYVEAKIAHEVNKAKISWDKDAAQRAAREGQAIREQTFEAKLGEAGARYGDFDEIVRDPSLPITPVIKEILMDSEIPGEVAYYLGKNRTETVRISRMTPFAAAREIAKIEARLAGNPPPAMQKKTVTNAPPPINPVGPRHTVEKDPEKMSQREYEEWRKKHGARRF